MPLIRPKPTIHITRYEVALWDERWGAKLQLFHTFGPSDYHSIVFAPTTRKLKHQKRTERGLSLKIAVPLLSTLIRRRATAHQQSQGLIVSSNTSGSGPGRASNLRTSQLMNGLIYLKVSSLILALVLRRPRKPCICAIVFIAASWDQPYGGLDILAYFDAEIVP